MNGPEHYHEAENLLHQTRAGQGVSPRVYAEVMERAQVHAMLALAAATALAYQPAGVSTEAGRAWGEVTR